MTPPDPAPVRRVLLAPDKFKGSLSAAEVAAALAQGISAAAPGLTVTACPIADGGDGTVAAALAAGSTPRTTLITGPTGEPHEARWASDGDTAVLELAQAVGLQALPDGRLAPHAASTRGLGELLRAAVEAGARTVVVGLGGSASTDAGAGLLQALGADLRTATGEPIAPGAAGLADLARADLAPARELLAGVRLIAANDVTNPLLGADGAAAVYGPQKGLAPGEVPVVDAVLARAAAVLDPSGEHAGRPGAGAAGGAGFALALLGAEQQAGADLVLDLVGFDEHLAAADLVVIGEGRLDVQTLQGKGPAEVARRAVARGLPVLAVAGSSALDPEDTARAGIAGVHEILPLARDLEDALARTAELLEEVGRALGREIAHGAPAARAAVEPASRALP